MMQNAHNCSQQTFTSVSLRLHLKLDCVHCISGVRKAIQTKRPQQHNYASWVQSVCYTTSIKHHLQIHDDKRREALDRVDAH